MAKRDDFTAAFNSSAGQQLVRSFERVESNPLSKNETWNITLVTGKSFRASTTGSGKLLVQTRAGAEFLPAIVERDGYPPMEPTSSGPDLFSGKITDFPRFKRWPVFQQLTTVPFPAANGSPVHMTYPEWLRQHGIPYQAYTQWTAAQHLECMFIYLCGKTLGRS